MRHRARIIFRKYGDLRFTGHRDLVRVFERMLRRTGVGLALSQGFHPKAKLSFPLALAVGIEGAHEILEVEFSDPIDVDAIAQQLKDECPPGLDVIEVRQLAENEKKVQPTSVEYRMPIPEPYLANTESAICDFLAKATYEVARPSRKKTVDARADIQTLEITDGELRIVQRITRTAAATPREILGILNLAGLESEGVWLTRHAINANCTLPECATENGREHAVAATSQTEEEPRK